MIYRILVTGSRDWDDVETIRLALNATVAALNFTRTEWQIGLVHGDCRSGADKIANDLASPKWIIERYPADWNKHGKRAGIIRNQKMVNMGADICLAFIKDSSPGATHCADIAHAAGIKTVYYTETTRPDWDTYFLNIAKAVATRADCSRRRVGAVVVKDNRIVSTGYNGSPPGGPSCLKGECPRGKSGVDPGSSYDTGPGSCVAVHAEGNAIIYGGRDGCISSSIYITDSPCDGCLKLIKASGVYRVVWPGGELNLTSESGASSATPLIPWKTMTTTTITPKDHSGRVWLA